jgi:hypothetical protein
MPEILALLAEIAANILEAIGILTTINNFLTTFFGNGPTLAQVNANVTQLQSTLQLFIGSATNSFNQILYDLGQEQDVTNRIYLDPPPAVLPTPAPPGYGGPAVSDVATAVWDYTQPGSSRPQGYWMVATGNYAQQRGTGFAPIPNPYSPLVLVCTDWEFPQAIPVPRNWPTVDPSQILAGDTLLTWIERTSGFNDWTVDASGYYTRFETTPGSDVFYTVALDAKSFALLQSGGGGGGSSDIAPVWPGLAKVNLGAAVALADQLTVNGPMHGIIVNITAEAGYRGYFTFGGMKSYRNCGGLVFLDDNGEAEFPQLLGLTDAVYCPKAMTLAQSVKIRTDGTAVGTVTPWTLK